MKICFRFFVVALLAMIASGVLWATVSHRSRDTCTPVVFSVTPSSPGPNADVQARVTLSAPSAAGDTITIGSTDPDAFTILPSEVYVGAGQSSVDFLCHTSSTYTGWTVIAATANGGTALAISN